MRRIKQAQGILILFFSTCVTVQAADMPNWQAIQGMDALSQKQTPCILESMKQSVNDGRTTTPMRIVYNGKAFLIKTRSNIDLTYKKLGLRVDNRPVHSIDHVYKETDVVFENDADKIREQFIKGKYGYITLGFWPTWPKSKSVVTRFNLSGFQAAYQDYLSCLNTHMATNEQQ